MSSIISALRPPHPRDGHAPDLGLPAARSPYRYGYITELRASKGFRYDNVKHYSMGRLAHEMGCAPFFARAMLLHSLCLK